MNDEFHQWFFMDGHTRVYVDNEDGCAQHGKDYPLYHVLKREGKKEMWLTTVRCPKSLSSAERAKLIAQQEKMAVR